MNYAFKSVILELKDTNNIKNNIPSTFQISQAL